MYRVGKARWDSVRFGFARQKLRSLSLNSLGGVDLLQSYTTVRSIGSGGANSRSYRPPSIPAIQDLITANMVLQVSLGSLSVLQGDMINIMLIVFRGWPLASIANSTLLFLTIKTTLRAYMMITATPDIRHLVITTHSTAPTVVRDG